MIIDVVVTNMSCKDVQLLVRLQHNTHLRSRGSRPKESWWAAGVPLRRPLCLCLELRLQPGCWLGALTGQSEAQGDGDEKILETLGHVKLNSKGKVREATLRIRWFSVSATYTASPLMATPWGELKEASEKSPSRLPLFGPWTEAMIQLTSSFLGAIRPPFPPHYAQKLLLKYYPPCHTPFLNWDVTKQQTFFISPHIFNLEKDSFSERRRWIHFFFQFFFS